MKGVISTVFITFLTAVYSEGNYLYLLLDKMFYAFLMKK